MALTEAERHHASVVPATIWPLAILATCAVILRFKARKMCRLSWQVDDYAVLFSLAVVYASCICATILLRYGLGKHQNEIESGEMSRFNHITFACNQLYLAGCPCIRISALLMYHRIFCTPRFQLVTQILIGVCLAWYVVEATTGAFITIPIPGSSKSNLPSKRIDCVTWTYQFVATTVILDIAILSLPVRKIYQLRLSTIQKVGLTCTFFLGAFTAVATFIRTILFFTNLKNPDYLYVDVYGAIWNVIEPSVGIITTCLPLLRPILSASFPTSLRQGLRSLCEPLARRQIAEDASDKTTPPLNGALDVKPGARDAACLAAWDEEKAERPTNRLDQELRKLDRVAVGKTDPEMATVEIRTVT